MNGLNGAAETRAAYWQLLEQRCRQAMERVDGVVGYGLRDLTTNEEFYHLPEAVFTTASSIKIPILMALYKAQAERKLSLDDRHTYDHSKHVGGSGILQLLDDRVELSLRDIANLMIHVSDNAATNICIGQVGFDYVNALMDQLGCHATRLRRKMIDSEAALRGDENVSTPKDFVRIMTLLYRGEFLSPEICQEILSVLRRHPKGLFGEHLHRLPSGSHIANKPGGLDAVTCDVGIIEIPNRPFVFVVMGNYLHDKADAGLNQLVATVFRYQSLLANTTAYGRQLPVEMFVDR